MVLPKKEPLSIFLYGVILQTILLMVQSVPADDGSSLTEINGAYLNLRSSSPDWHSLKYDWRHHHYEEYKIRQIVLEINKNDTDKAVQLFSELNDNTNYYLIYTIVKEAYAGDSKNTFKIVNFINKLPWCNHQYSGYEFLFGEFKFNDHLRTSDTFQFAYQLKKFLDGSPSCLHENDDVYIVARVKTLRDNLPEGVKLLIWNGTKLCIKTNEFEEHLYGAECCKYDGERRRVFTWIPKGEIGSQGEWTFEFVDGLFRIKSDDYQEYLYAPDCCKYNGKRRNVFTWIPKGEIGSQGEWELELVNGSSLFRIRSTYFNEYLYAAKCCLYNDERRSVFTWIPKADIGPQGEWEISRC